ncbi:MAG: signal peptidase I [Caldilineaceae bacterium]|nr:signal peptidase I [Caldilineaceae bacterium]
MTDSTNNMGDQYTLQPDAVLTSDVLSGELLPDEPTQLHSPDAALNSEQANSGPSPAWMLFRELAETIVLSLVIFLVIRQVVQNYRIESHSMEPNFYEGQFILVNKLAYKLGEPTRGDVIVFHNPNNTDEDYIKRVIGLPGDTVEMLNGAVVVNGVAIDESYGPNPMSSSASFGPELVAPDHLFVMGDNRPNSTDSRRFGQLNQDLIVGRAWVRVWPVANWDVIQHEVIEPQAATARGP